MMEIMPFHGKHYDADCRTCAVSYRGSYKQATEFRAEHNQRMHPRRWRRMQRRLEILAELQSSVRELRPQDFADARSMQHSWDGALAFAVPPLERGRLKAEGLLPNG